jgi:RIO kinase 1
MIQDDTYIDRYEYYEALFDPLWTGTQAGRVRARDSRSALRRSDRQIVAELTDDMADLELGFRTTYRPSRYEEGWLFSSLRAFYDEGLITDVISLVKGGKEASVYCCQAHPATGHGLLAAKVYRPRMFRNLRNDKMYRQGREVLTADGRPAGKQAGTIARAIRNKTPYGRVARHTSWLMHEYTALDTLYRAGAAVPRPISSSPNAVLMSYHGDAHEAAPTLNRIRFDRDEAERLLGQVLENVDLMLGLDLVHGDLSAYNILYWEGKMTIIDLPQVVNLRANPKARTILQRDIQRTCQYFALQGVECDADATMDELWSRHVEEVDPMQVAAEWSRLVEASEEPLDEEDQLGDRWQDQTAPHS